MEQNQIKFSQISTKELENKEKILISQTEILRQRIIQELNKIEKNCKEIKEIQEELNRRKQEKI
jgi:hypothetical protein